MGWLEGRQKESVERSVRDRRGVNARERERERERESKDEVRGVREVTGCCLQCKGWIGSFP